MQFINIVVHSTENINLRVYLQYGFHLLGLDDFLKCLQARPGDRLNRHIEAYLANRVDCGVLLDDAEAKEAAQSERDRLVADLAELRRTSEERITQVKVALWSSDSF
ncbi:unnamed protein product [Protopolystoma xenopodis]|uniref:Formin FH3 domain-containing protein n=1 Tax=Protopolystoma xenopodis TaxID=117903 RepID=A0A448WAE0_9PLAT|nr:unnamed protein product [Protopolystoma xenopodis]